MATIEEIIQTSDEHVELARLREVLRKIRDILNDSNMGADASAYAISVISDALREE